MSVIMIVEAVLELPMGQALVRLPVVSPAHYDTAFTLGLLRGLGVALILLVLSWPFAKIYGDDRLLALICVLGIAPAARSLGSTRMIDFARKLDFRRNLICEFVGKSAAFTVSVGLAWETGSYWAIVAGTIAAPIAGDVASYLLAPHWPRLTLRKWRAFAGFLGWSTAAQAVNALNWQMDQLLLGRFISRPELGRFSMAANLAVLPTQVIVLQVWNPLMVAFSLIRGDSRRLAAAYRHSATTVVAAGLPMLVGMSIIAEPMIRLILGEQWVESAPILRWLALAVIPSLFVAAFAPLAMALNRTHLLLRLSLIEFFFKLPLVLVGAVYFGVAGVLVTRLATAVVTAACSMWMVRDMIGLTVRTQMFGPWRSIISAMIMTLAIVPFETWLSATTDTGSLALRLAAVVCLAAVAYVSSIVLLWRLAGSPAGFELKIATFLHRLCEMGR
jgi:O-antigen/teichoic acid export membrane protein